MSKKALIEKKNELIVRAEGIVNEAEAQKRELTDAEAAEIAEIRDDVRKIKAKIGVIDDVEEMDREAACGDEKSRAEGEAEEATDEETAAAEERSFDAELRGMWADMNTRDDVTPLSKGANGAIVPKTIAKRIIRKIYDISPILEKSTKYNVKGTFSIPQYTEDAENYINVAFQGAEFTKISANSGKFTSISLADFVAGALVLISRQLINASDFDLVGYVIDRMAYSVRRFLERVLLNGSGPITGQTGVVEGLTGVTKTVYTASASAITTDNLIDLQDSVPDEFQEGAIFICNPKTRTALRKLKDNMGRYLLNENVANAFGRELLGKPLYVSDNMPEMEAGKVAVYYGDMSRLALKFTRNLEIQVLREKYATSYADGINGWFSFDSKVENAQKIAKLVMGNQVSA